MINFLYGFAVACLSFIIILSLIFALVGFYLSKDERRAEKEKRENFKRSADNIRVVH